MLDYFSPTFRDEHSTNTGKSCIYTKDTVEMEHSHGDTRTSSNAGRTTVSEIIQFYWAQPFLIVFFINVSHNLHINV
jgi:hypothetical protein